jgi:hypothetical protein
MPQNNDRFLSGSLCDLGSPSVCEVEFFSAHLRVGKSMPLEIGPPDQEGRGRRVMRTERTRCHEDILSQKEEVHLAGSCKIGQRV